MSNIVPFSFEGVAVRTIIRDEEPWFVLVDVCRVLEVENSRNAAARLDDDERGVHTVDTPSAAQQMTIINESGLYSLILTSRKPEAKRFKKWITAEVIPSIRKTGSYGTSDPMTMLNDPAAMRGLLLSYSERVLSLEAANAAMVPKVDALDRIASADGSLCITDAAKALQVRQKDLFGYLLGHGWIYKRPGGGAHLGYQARVAAGWLEHKVTTVLRGDGTEKVVEQVRITSRGLTRLAEVMPAQRLVA